MLIVISPAKTLDYETPVIAKKHTQPLFMDRSAELVDILRGYTPKRLSKLMGISAKLAELNVQRFAQWEAKSTKKNARQALLAFKGDVYVGLEASRFGQDDFAFAQEHLRILSGLYGLLRPLDLIQPYRLEMGTQLKNRSGKDLYDFWGDTITTALNKQLKKTSDEVLVNLASNEYFQSIRRSKLNARVVTPVFKDEKNGEYKVISFFAKKARGLMSGWIIRKRITDPKRLVRFADAGYRFAPQESTHDSPVFLRNGP